MAQAYSDPKRESDPHALPDVEVWESEVYRLECRKCGDFEIDKDVAVSGEAVCPSCERTEDVEEITKAGRTAWWYWYCFPGCMPDSDVRGPFATEAEALADAQEGNDDDD